MWMWFVMSASLWFWGKPVDPAKAPPPELQASPETPYRVIQFPGPIQDAWREALLSRGITIYSYVKENAYLVRLPEQAGPELLQGLPVVGNFPYQPAWKIEPDLGKRTFENPERVKDNRWWLAVDAFPDADLFDVVDALEKAGAWIETWTETQDPVVKRVWVRIPKDPRVLAALARIPEVWMIRERLEYRTLNNRNRWVLQGNVQNPMDTTVWSHGIHGEDQIITVMDSDLNETRCWFSGTDYAGRPKVILNSPAPGSPTGNVDYCNACEHGTHVAGTVLGKTTGANAQYNGLAYEARLIFQDVQNGCGSIYLDVPSTLIPALDTAWTRGSRVHTNSWGANTNSYTSDAQDFDNFLFSHQEFLVTVAMGNNSSSGAFEDSSIGAPATAKNVTSIGSTNHPPHQNTRSWFSSQGPTYDGRIKPDVMAPGGDAMGNETHSADASQTCGVCDMSGTSMATPAAAGAAALVFQYFEKGYYPSGQATPADAFTPLGSLVKAMLVNSGEDLTGEPQRIPNSEQGWGRIKLRNVLYFPGDPFKLFVVNATSGPTTGQTLTYTIYVDQGYPLKVALAWYDAPGSNLVNNLDLEVVDPNGTVYKGNVFSNGWSTTGGTADNKNTVEAVRIQNPTPGMWTIRVKGTNVPQPASSPYSGQPFGLVATYKELPPVNAPAISVSPPDTVFMNAGCTGTQDSIQVRNVGTQTLNVTDVQTTQAPRLIVDGPTNFSLNQNQFQWVRFHVDTSGLTRGMYYLGDLIIHSNDPDPADNPYTVWVKVAMPYPYDPQTNYGPDDLETSNGGWTPIPNDGWAWGSPSGGGNPGAHSGTRVWGTVLNGNYDNNLDWKLDKKFYRNYYCGTPSFIIWHWYDFENGYDGGNVKISLDGGATWSVLSPRGGYDGTIPTGFGSAIGGEQAFTGNSGGWISDTFDLVSLAFGKNGGNGAPVELLSKPGDSVIIRFHFATDNFVRNHKGWYIDDLQAVGLSPSPVLPMSDSLALEVGEISGRVPVFRMTTPPVTRGELGLAVNLPRGGRLTVDLYDASGRRVRRLFNGVMGPGVQEIRSNLHLAPGVYFLKARAGDVTFDRRLVVVR